MQLHDRGADSLCRSLSTAPQPHRRSSANNNNNNNNNNNTTALTDHNAANNAEQQQQRRRHPPARPAWHGVVRHGTAWHGMARHGTAWHGVARHGTAWHGMPACIAGFESGQILYAFFEKFQIAADWPSLVFVLYNFAIAGAVGILFVTVMFLPFPSDSFT